MLGPHDQTELLSRESNGVTVRLLWSRGTNLVTVAVADATSDDFFERAADEFAYSESLPSYRAMLDIEGVAHAADVALIGDEATVTKKLRALADAGLTDYCARLVGSEEEQRRSIEFLGSVNPV